MRPGHQPGQVIEVDSGVIAVGGGQVDRSVVVGPDPGRRQLGQPRVKLRPYLLGRLCEGSVRRGGALFGYQHHTGLNAHPTCHLPDFRRSDSDGTGSLMGHGVGHGSCSR
jgi:hypothetical protein